MNTLEWFGYLEHFNGRMEVARMFNNGEWKIDFKENAPTFVCLADRECKYCSNCTREFCLCSIECTENISHSLYHEQMLMYCSEYNELCD
jgi:hypothetical protein